ncbi:MAG: nucleotidyltransferase family protein, partial [Clostridiales bacterium]|nr:nucleotidyltransferase family protein [Clostridiales bacterium]
MRVAGVIAEYNPFHLGHRHHLAEARRRSGCDYVVAAMGGSFSQRGEPMLLDKWARAKMALLGGADLVVELPALFAVRSAEGFAAGGVRLLAALSCDSLAFGCEVDDLELLRAMADALDDESPAFREELKRSLAQGRSHARARGDALARCLSASPEAVGSPNAVLAVEYLRANRRLAAPMEPVLVPRVGGYHDTSLSGLASATAIRAALRSGRRADALAAMPAEAAAVLEAAWPGAADPAGLDNLLLYTLRRLSADDIAALPDVSEGLERRVKRCAESAHDRASLIEAVKCKRYTHARLSRLCCHALLGLTRTLTAQVPQPPYARLLGFRR